MAGKAKNETMFDRPTDYTREPVGIWKPLDYLSRIQYPIQNVLRRLTDPKEDYPVSDYLKSLWSGVSGKERSQFSDVLGNVGWEPKSKMGMVGKAAVGLAGDILLDPSTYVGGLFTKVGKAGSAGKIIKVADKLVDTTKEVDVLVDLAKTAGATSQTIDKLRDATKGVNTVKRIENITGALREAGLKAEIWKPAATAVGQFDEGSRRLLNFSLPFSDARASVTLPGERSLWNTLTKTNKAIKSSEASYIHKLATGGIPTGTEKLSAGLGNLKRAFSILPEKVKQIAQGARGETVSHAKAFDRLIEAGGGVPKIPLNSKQTESVELLGSLTSFLPDGWQKISDPDVLKGHLKTVLDSSTFSDARKTRISEALETFQDQDDIRRALNMRDVVERGNIYSGLTTSDIALARLEKSGAGNAEIAYVPHKIEAASRELKAFHGGTGSTKPRSHSVFQTIYEAQEGIVDTKVREFLENPSRINEVVVEGAGGKKYTGKELLETMSSKLPFESDLVRLSERQFAKQLPTLKRRTFSNALAKFGAPMAESVEQGQMPMARLFDQQYLGWLHRVHPKEYDSVIHTQLPTEIYLAAQGFLEVERNPGAFWQSLKSIGDLIKPWLLVSPGFHTRNFVSSILMTHVGGDNIFLPATLSKFSETVKLLLDPDASRVVNGVEYSSDELMKLYTKTTGEGSLSATAIFGDVGKDAQGKVGKAWNALPKASREVGNKVETLFRFNHFLNRLDDGYSPVAAAQSVAKHFYDYADLSPSERKLQAIVPFYSWMRKNTEANLRYLIDAPGYMAAPGKAKNELESASPAPAYPDQYLPEWLKSKGAVRMPWQGNAGEPIYSTAQGWLPQMDAPMIMQAVGGNPKDLIAFLMQSIHPAIQKPAELGLNKSFLTGREIAPKGDETQTFYGIPGIDKRIVDVASLIRPLREIDRVLQIGGPEYRKKGGGFTDPPRSVEALRFATGWKGYPMPEEKIFTDRYRQLTSERTNMRYLARKYAGTPKEAEIKRILDDLDAEYKRLRPIVGPILGARSKSKVGLTIDQIMNKRNSP